jgi:hypothetical protein
MRALVIKIAAISFAMAISLGAVVRAEGVARFESIPDKSKVAVDGTSTLHDWTVKSPNISGHLAFTFNVPSDAPPKVIREAIVANPSAEVDVSIAVKWLKSGDKAMDTKMYEALKRDKNPTITYRLTKLELAKDANAEQSQFEVQTTGDLTIAGTTRELQMPMVLEVVDSQHVRISGKTTMKMTTYKVKPPEAMMGMIKSGDKISVEFEWNTARVVVPQAVTQSK